MKVEISSYKSSKNEKLKLLSAPMAIVGGLLHII